MLERLDADVTEHIAKVFLPRLGEMIAQELPGDRTWRVDIDAHEPKTVLFRYPSSLTGTAYDARAYLSPGVRLELGARGDAWPSENHELRAYAAEEFPAMFKAPTTQVPVLAAERTFWEKATLLHEEYHRPADKPTGERLSRHFYDLALLADTPYGGRAVRIRPPPGPEPNSVLSGGWASRNRCPGAAPAPGPLTALSADYDEKP